LFALTSSSLEANAEEKKFEDVFLGSRPNIFWHRSLRRDRDVVGDVEDVVEDVFGDAEDVVGY
jgi:hypothetical protein